MYQLISLAFISGSTVLYASYLCLSLIYCLTHMECFCFFDLDAIIAAPKLHTTTAVHGNDYFVFVIHFGKNRSDIGHTWAVVTRF